MAKNRALGGAAVALLAMTVCGCGSGGHNASPSAPATTSVTTSTSGPYAGTGDRHKSRPASTTGTGPRGSTTTASPVGSTTASPKSDGSSDSVQPAVSADSKGIHVLYYVRNSDLTLDAVVANSAGRRRVSRRNRSRAR